MAKKLVYGINCSTWRNFQEIKRQIDHAAEIDADIIHLSPLFPANEVDVHECAYTYAVTDFMGIDPKYGTIEEFVELVKYANSKNLKIYLELPITYTSVKHPWFREHPEYYLYRSHMGIDTINPSWVYDKKEWGYYLQLFGSNTANLRWFIAEYPFRPMIDNFKTIISYWYYIVGVDGFYISDPQTINYGVNGKENGTDRAIEVIKSIFDWSEHPETVKKPGLIIEIHDDLIGDIVDLYAKETGALVMDLSLKDLLKKSPEDFSKLADIKGENLLLSLEDCKSSRFEVPWIEHQEQLIWQLFSSNAENIYLFQGQELGVRNIHFENILRRDKKVLQFYQKNVSDKSYMERGAMITLLQCANAYIRVPQSKYGNQRKKIGSCFNITKAAIDKWRKNY